LTQSSGIFYTAAFLLHSCLAYFNHWFKMFCLSRRQTIDKVGQLCRSSDVGFEAVVLVFLWC